MIIIKYTDESEANTIISEKTASGYTLIEVQNINEGNFLGFLEPTEVRQTEEQKLLSSQISLINNNMVLIQKAVDELILGGL